MEGEERVSTVLRAGTIIGLGLVIVGLLLQHLTVGYDLPHLGLWLIVATPPVALAILAVSLLERGDRRSFALAVLMLAVMILSSILLASRH